LLTLTAQNFALAEALGGTSNEFMEAMVEIYDEKESQMSTSRTN
jgi:hypothetical protein